MAEAEDELLWLWSAVERDKAAVLERRQQLLAARSSASGGRGGASRLGAAAVALVAAATAPAAVRRGYARPPLMHDDHDKGEEVEEEHGVGGMQQAEQQHNQQQQQQQQHQRTGGKEGFVAKQIHTFQGVMDSSTVSVLAPTRPSEARLPLLRVKEAEVTNGSTISGNSRSNPAADCDGVDDGERPPCCDAEGDEERLLSGKAATSSSSGPVNGGQLPPLQVWHGTKLVLDPADPAAACRGVEAGSNGAEGEGSGVGQDRSGGDGSSNMGWWVSSLGCRDGSLSLHPVGGSFLPDSGQAAATSTSSSAAAAGAAADSGRSAASAAAMGAGGRGAPSGAAMQGGEEPGKERTLLHTLWYMLADVLAVARGPERRAFALAAGLAFFDQVRYTWHVGQAGGS